MKFKPINIRKFLYTSPMYADYVLWTVDKYDNKGYVDTDKEYKVNTTLEITLGNGGAHPYTMYLSKGNGSKESVQKALEPLNNFISELSRAATEFAKTCNTPWETKKEPEVKPAKKAKSDKPKK